MDDLKKCCFCGKEIEKVMANNPRPVCTIEDACCCIECNWRVVIPARMAKIPAPDDFEMPKFTIVSGEAQEGKSLLNAMAN